MKDHLGNTRVTFADLNNSGTIDPNTEINQINHYYPFGLNMEGNWNGASADAKNKYQYGGKELNTDFGLDWNDHGARFYDATIGKWNGVDPKASKLASYSPYAFCLNRSIILADPDGQYPILTITSNPTGYTVMKLPGAPNGTTVTVRTYTATLSDVRSDGTVVKLGDYNVTRAGFVSLGQDANGMQILENRGFTPPKTTTYRAELFNYHGDAPALALRQYREVTTGIGKNKKTQGEWSGKLDATPLNNHFLANGQPLPDAINRENPAIANGIMVHIGCYYNDKNGNLCLAGAYRCIGVVNPNNVKQTREEVDAASASGLLEINLSNTTMNDLATQIKGATEDSGDNKGRIDVVIDNPTPTTGKKKE